MCYINLHFTYLLTYLHLMSFQLELHDTLPARCRRSTTLSRHAIVANPSRTLWGSRETARPEGGEERSSKVREECHSWRGNVHLPTN